MMHQKWWIVFVFLYCAQTSTAQKNGIRIHTNYENANGKLLKQDARLNLLGFAPVPKIKDREALWFNFKLTGHRKDTCLTLMLPFLNYDYAPDPIAVQQHGIWQRLPATDHAVYKSYTIDKPQADTIQIATGVPYTYTQLLDWLKEQERQKSMYVDTLCMSEKSRWVPLLRFSKTMEPNKPVILVVARQHAFEAPCSYFAEGFATFWIEQKKLLAKLNKDYQILMVPMMDVDNVAEGAFGKDQYPIDFNRSWLGRSPWNAVQAVQQLSMRYPIAMAFDFHAPYPISRVYSHYYNEFEAGSEKHERLNRLMQIMSTLENDKLSFQRNNRIKPGEMTFCKYFSNPDCADTLYNCKNGLFFATTYEQSWQVKRDGTAYEVAQIKQAGKHLAQALSQFLTELEKEK